MSVCNQLHPPKITANSTLMPFVSYKIQLNSFKIVKVHSKSIGVNLHAKPPDYFSKSSPSPSHPNKYEIIHLQANQVTVNIKILTHVITTRESFSFYFQYRVIVFPVS